MKEEREEEYIYAGIPTYMGGEFIREKEIKDYGIFLSKRSIIAFTKSKNNYEIASGIKVRNKKDFEDVYNIIKEKCKKAMEGYSEENVEKYIKILKK